MPVGMPVPNRSNMSDARLPDWMEMSEYLIQLDSITDTFSSGEYVLENVPPDTYLVALEWRVSAVFVGSSEADLMTIQFGDSASYGLFGQLTTAQLMSTGSFGTLPINFHASGSGGISLTAYLVNDDAIQPSSGTLELWLRYRPRASEPILGGRKAK